MRRARFLVAGRLLLLLPATAALPAQAQVPSGYPAGYSATIAAAKKEGKLTVYGTTDVFEATPLVEDFKALYPFLAVEYTKMNSTALYNRLISETAAGSKSADTLWSSAMDLQIKLVSRGYTQAYDSPEIRNLPAWAVWRKEAFGTTFEPAVIVANKRLLPEKDIPKSHAELIQLLETKLEALRGRVTTYDPEHSGVGYILLTQDAKRQPKFWDFAHALGRVNVHVYTSTQAMMERISSGEHILGYNMVGSYAFLKAQTDPVIAVVLPKDYTLILSRVLCIAKAAPHPNGARLWVDYLLSKRGQRVIANQSRLFSVRPDVTGEGTAAALRKSFGAASEPIGLGEGLLENLDQAKRLDFLRQWQKAALKRP